ncbi:MAG: hypothetical protein K6E47_11695 [Lachnospiraceae bacterium]|nr:hypothetical protein [Lachnospiraceae bacterium]
MKKTVLLPLLIIILTASMFISGCSKEDNTEEKDIPNNQVASVTPEPVASVTPKPEDEDKYHITGKDLDPEVVASFQEYICEHTVSMGRFLMDRYVYFDITGDGKPDLCASVTHGSGIISTGIFVYDIENRQGYQLQDRGEYDYWVDSVKDGAVYIKKAFFGRRNMLDGAVGKLEFIDGELRYNGPEPDKSDLPTPVIRPTTTVTETPTPELTEGIITEITTNWYKFELPEKWKKISSRLSVSVDADGSVILSDVIADREILKITTVTDIDSAWALLDDENEYASSIFSKDHIFVLKAPAELKDYTFVQSNYELNDLAKNIVILKDGETNEAVRSIRPEHIKRFINLYNSDGIDRSELEYRYGIEKVYCDYNSPLYGVDLYTFIDTETYPFKVNVISDEDGMHFIECPIKIGYLATCIFSFDYDDNGIKEYGIIPYLDDYVDEASHEYDHLLIAEKSEASEDYTVYEFDSAQAADFITTQLALTVDLEDDHNAVFSLAGEKVLEVKCENVIADRDYELKYLCILEAEELGSFYSERYKADHFTAVFRANLPVKNGNDGYDKKYAPLVLVNVTYKGKGIFEPSDIIVKNWGKGLPEVEFSEDKHLDYEQHWALREEAMEKLADTAAKLGKTQEDIKEQNFQIMSIEEDGTVVLRGYYDPARVYNDSGEMSDDPADYEVEEGLVPYGEEVVMKISEDCPIIYLHKNTGVERYLLTISELKTIFDVCNSVEHYFTILYSDPDREWIEYYRDFTCVYMDGVIYFMAEQYYP